MSPLPIDFLRHIRDECEYLIEATAGIDYGRFRADATLRRATVRALEIIGEATKHLPPEVRTQHEQVPWKQLARLRDRLSHGYFDIDYEIVWQAATVVVPAVLQAVTALIVKAEKTFNEDAPNAD